MNILIVAQADPSACGGAEVSLRTSCRLLREEGHTVTVVHGGNRVTEFAKQGLQETFVPSMAKNMVWTSRIVKEIKSTIMHLQPDLIHFELVTTVYDSSIFDWSANNFATTITPRSLIFSCPIVKKLFNHPPSSCMRKAGKGCWVGNYVHRCGSRRPLRFSRVLSNYRRLVRSALRVQKAIVLSQYLADTLLQVGFSIDRIKVVPPAILVGSPIPLKNPGQENKDILFIGRLEWYKGIQYLLQASKMVGNAHRILVVGDGPYMPNLKMLAADLGVENRTIFLGARTSDEISQIYRRSKVVVVPSIVQETFGRVVVEAMAHGKPVVAFNVGAVSEWLEDSKTGFLIKPGDIHTLAKKLEFLLSEAEIADEMGQCGEEMIKSNLSREIHLKGLLGAYQEAIDAYGDVT